MLRTTKVKQEKYLGTRLDLFLLQLPYSPDHSPNEFSISANTLMVKIFSNKKQIQKFAKTFSGNSLRGTRTRICRGAEETFSS